METVFLGIGKRTVVNKFWVFDAVVFHVLERKFKVKRQQSFFTHAFGNLFSLGSLYDVFKVLIYVARGNIKRFSLSCKIFGIAALHNGRRIRLTPVAHLIEVFACLAYVTHIQRKRRQRRLGKLGLGKRFVNNGYAFRLGRGDHQL